MLPSNFDVQELAKLVTNEIDSHKSYAREEHKSKLSETVPYRIMNNIRCELRNLGCKVGDLVYNFEAHASGYDITISGIKCTKEARKQIIEALKDAIPDAGHKLDKYPTRYAYATIHGIIAELCRDKLGLDCQAWWQDKRDSDVVVIAVTEQAPEDLEPEEDLDELDDTMPEMPIPTTEPEGDFDLGPKVSPGAEEPAEEIVAGIGGEEEAGTLPPLEF